MNKLNDYSDCNNLIKILNKFYKLNFEEIYLHREVIGYVYFVKSSNKKYVLKLYRHVNSDEGRQSIEVIQYLKKLNYPVVSIVPTDEDSLYVKFTVPEGECIGILYDYIDGIELEEKEEIIEIGEQIGGFHNLMEKYPNSLIKRGKDFYIDRFIAILQKLNYNSEKVEELKRYGNELWSSMERLPRGFCHGDLHTGNMLKTKANECILFDFDMASYGYSIIDIATLCDSTNFFKYDEWDYDNTKTLFEKFYEGYSKKRSLTNIEIDAIFDFIAIRHYELIATLTNIRGLQCLSHSYLDEQFQWLMNWRKLCNLKRLV